MYWFLLAFVLLILMYLGFQNYTVSKSFYKLHIPKMHPKAMGKKIIFFSDTHFRERNTDYLTNQLLEEIEAEAPAVILFGGDIVHANATDRVVEYTKDFFFQVSKIAPTYLVYGNHDLRNPRRKELTATLKIAGVHLLTNEAQWISFGEVGVGFWLMGLTQEKAYLQTKKDLLTTIDLPQRSYSEPKILLTHFPQYFEQYLVAKDKRPDLVLTGHVHGGQVILPVIGGLFAPGQGVSPTFDFGLFYSDRYPSSRLIVSRGIGNSSFPFRVNNRPEIVVIEFE